MDTVDGGDPPDDPNAIAAPADTLVSMTPIGDSGMRINFDASSPPPQAELAANSSIVHGGSKRKRINSDNSTDGICASVDDNILPLVKSGVCEQCKVKCTGHEMMVCCSCNKFFHGTCKSVVEKVRCNPVMPAQSHVTYFNQHLMRGDGIYMAGRFLWMCASCVNLKEIGSNKYHYDRMAMLESAVIQNSIHYNAMMKQMQDTLNLLNDKVSKLSTTERLIQSGNPITVESGNPITVESGNPITVEPSHPCNTNQLVVPEQHVVNSSDTSKTYAESITNCQSSSAVVPSKIVLVKQHVTHPIGNTSISREKQIKFNYRLKLISKDQNIPIMTTLRKLADDGKLIGYDNYRTKGKQAIELLFATSEEVSTAYTELSNLFNADANVDVFNPDIINPSRTYFVGLSETDTADSARKKLNARYPELQLNGKNRWALKMFDPKPCIRDSSTFRATVFLSRDLHQYITVNFNNRFRLGNFESWCVYSYISRCSKCQSFEHSFDTCNHPDPVCAKCAGKHFTSKCNANEDDFCCCNCKRSTEFSSGHKSHSADSANCPVYMEAKRGSKN